MYARVARVKGDGTVTRTSSTHRALRRDPGPLSPGICSLDPRRRSPTTASGTKGNACAPVGQSPRATRQRDPFSFEPSGVRAGIASRGVLGVESSGRFAPSEDRGERDRASRARSPSCPPWCKWTHLVRQAGRSGSSPLGPRGGRRLVRDQLLGVGRRPPGRSLRTGGRARSGPPPRQAPRRLTGGLVVHQCLRHRHEKGKFQVRYWVTVVGNFLAIVAPLGFLAMGG